MNYKSETANARTFAVSKTSLIKNQQTFNANDYKAETIVETRQKGKVIKLFRCFGCNECFPAERMGAFLVICPKCLNLEHFEDKRMRQRFITKTLNKIGTFLGRRI